MRWIETYINGRSSKAHFAGELPGTIPMRSGVLQGSVAVPLLFIRERKSGRMLLLFTNDVNIVTLWAQKISLQIYFVSSRRNWTRRLYLPIEITS